VNGDLQFYPPPLAPGDGHIGRLGDQHPVGPDTLFFYKHPAGQPLAWLLLDNAGHDHPSAGGQVGAAQEVGTIEHGCQSALHVAGAQAVEPSALHRCAEGIAGAQAAGIAEGHRVPCGR
jgi:hypothetical protein